MSSDTQTLPRAATRHSPAPALRARLVLVHPPSAAAVIPLPATGASSVGRASSSASADIAIADGTISRQHALLTREGSGWSISDVGSLNGTYVNRAIVTGPRRLEPGDEVQIGKYRFAYLVSGAPAPGGSGTT